MSIDMKKFVLPLLVAIFCGFVQNTQAQDENLSCVVHIDKPVYVTGELIWYKVYLPTFLHESFAVLASLHDAEGRSVEQFFIRTEGKSSFSGYYKIPFDLDAGIYRMHFAAHSQHVNRTEELLTFSIPIYNDLKPNDENISLSDVAEAPSSAGDLKVSAQIEDQIKLRDAIVTMIKVADEEGQAIAGDVSVSVTDAELFAGMPYAQTVFRGKELDRFNLQELENSVFIKGTVFRQETGEPVALNVLGGYSGTDNRIYYTKSFSDGRFILKFPDFSGSKPIQFLGYHREESKIRVELDQPKIDPISQDLKYTNSVLEYMNWSRLRKKIYQYYDTQETILNAQAIVHPVQELDPDATYIMDEYESFETVSSFFNELMSALSFSLDDDSLYTASMYNPSGRAAKNTYLNGPPLFIIDDKATRDADFAARMSASPIETMELFLQPKKLLSQFKALGISGVVRIKTKFKDIEVPKADREDVFAISGLQPRAEFLISTPSLPDQQPSFAPVLHWADDSQTDATGSTNLSFNQTDDLSRFLIKVVVVDAEGRLGEGSATFQSIN